MTVMFRAELLKLHRRRVFVAAALGSAAFAAISAIAVFLSAGGTAAPASGRDVTLAALGEAGGATAAFASGASVTGLFVFVLFIANVAGEFSQGTFRTLLIRQPRRVALLAGKLAALLAFAAGVLLLTELLTAVASTLIAPSQDVSTSSWFSAAGLGNAATDYGRALIGVMAWASLGTMLAVLMRSIPVALGIGIVWAGPLEHLTQNAWQGSTQWFPGLLLEAQAVGGNADVGYARTLVLLALYVTAGLAAAAVMLVRRDVTS